MRPWIDPREGRAGRYFRIQIIAAVVTGVLAVYLVLQDPTREHLAVGATVVLLGCLGLFLSRKALKRLPHEYRMADEEDRTKAGDPQ